MIKTASNSIYQVLSDAVNLFIEALLIAFLQRPETVVNILNQVLIPDTNDLSESETENIELFEKLNKQVHSDWDKTNHWYYDQTTESLNLILINDWFLHLYKRSFETFFKRRKLQFTITNDENKCVIQVKLNNIRAFLGNLQPLNSLVTDLIKTKFNDCCSQLKRITVPELSSQLYEIVSPENPHRFSRLKNRMQNYHTDSDGQKLIKTCEQNSENLTNKIHQFKSIEAKCKQVVTDTRNLPKLPAHLLEQRHETTKLDMLTIHFSDLLSQYHSLGEQILSVHAQFTQAYQNLETFLDKKRLEEEKEESKPRSRFALFWSSQEYKTATKDLPNSLSCSA